MTWSRPEVFAFIVPEILVFDNHEDRVRAWRAAYRQEFGCILISIMVGMIVWLPAFILGSRIIFVNFDRYLGRGVLVLMYIFGLATFSIVPWVMIRLSRNVLRRALRKQLMARGIPVCPKCGYDMRGCSGSRCPECGADYSGARS